jgi:lysophospholipid acyltransferase (LPLAT)-like uncharacterized protein
MEGFPKYESVHTNAPTGFHGVPVTDKYFVQGVLMTIKRQFNRILYRWIFPYAGLGAVKFMSFTNRLRLVDSENESRFLGQGKSLIYTSWHQRFFPGITFFALRRPIAIMISQSKDGEFISHIVKILGWEPVRGSSTRGGREALDRLNELAISGFRIGHIVDGPKGPFGMVKPGLLKIAQVTGLPIVPTITSAQKRWVLSSWDKFMIPKLFSKVIIRFGEPIYVPADISEEDFEAARREVETKLEQLYADTDRIWDDPERVKAIFSSR